MAHLPDSAEIGDRMLIAHVPFAVPAAGDSERCAVMSLPFRTPTSL